jgi:hypothetical protein
MLDFDCLFSQFLSVLVPALAIACSFREPQRKHRPVPAHTDKEKKKRTVRRENTISSLLVRFPSFSCPVVVRSE